MNVLKISLPCVLAALILCGCAGSHKELLATDYRSMSDDELLRYYYTLDDEIRKCVNQSNRASVGVGSGFGLHRLGVWLGLSHGIPTCNPEKLSQRRTDVRIEMQHRRLAP